MNGIAKCRVTPRPNACTVFKFDTKFLGPPCDSDLLQNRMGSYLAHTSPCHQVSLKLVWYGLQNLTDIQANITKNFDPSTVSVNVK